MSDLPALRDPQQCSYKQALIEDIRHSIRLATTVLTQELEDTVNGSYQTAQFYAARLHEARESRGALIEQLGRHVNEHGC